MMDQILGVNLSDMDFMTSRLLNFQGSEIRVSRCGYTGEDGFEVSVPEKLIHNFADSLTLSKDQSGA